MNSSARYFPHALLIAFIYTVNPVTAFGQGEASVQGLEHDGSERQFRIFQPSSHDPNSPLPLVVNIHGFSFDSGFQQESTQMNTVAEREGFIVAYPDALNNDWFPTLDAVAESTEFIAAMLDHIESVYSIDEERVYATGFSQGAQLSYALARAIPDRIAAIAPVSGTQPKIDPGVELPLWPDRPVPVLHIHGTADAVSPYDGGIPPFGGLDWQSAPGEVASWAEHNGCASNPTDSTLPNLEQADQSSISLVHYSECAEYTDSSGVAREVETLLYQINHGGHNWPGDSPTSWPPLDESPWFGTVNQDISASEVIWEFFDRHRLPSVAVPEPNDGHVLTLVIAIGFALSRKPRNG